MEFTYGYEEVKNILCDACCLGVPSVRDCDSRKFYHVLNGCRVECLANEWINKSELPDLVDEGCPHCGAGDDNHHSYTCPTNLHPDKVAKTRRGQCL